MIVLGPPLGFGQGVGDMAVTNMRKTPKGRLRAVSTRTPKYVYSFANGKADGRSAMRPLLGGKGCELAEMTNLGVPVPPGFTITTEAWAAYHRSGHTFPDGMWEQVSDALEKLEHDAGLVLGDPKHPLLVSVRSGARVSMPG